MLHPEKVNVPVEIGLPYSYNIVGIHTAHMMEMNMLDPPVDFSDLAERTHSLSEAEMEGFAKSTANVD